MFGNFGTEYAKAESEFRAEQIRRGTSNSRRRAHDGDVEQPVFRSGKRAR